MRLLVSLLLAWPAVAAESASWQAIFSSIGLLDHASIVVLEGDSGQAASYGFRATAAPHVVVRGVEDVHAPNLRIIWEKSANVPVFEIPAGARVFTKERHQGAPLMAGFRRGLQTILWVAVPPGEHGYERFPYIPQALVDLGIEPPSRSARLWAFFDSAYRARVDLDYFAERWHNAGISALHVAAWHYWERDPASDEYLRHLIDACHRQAISVYAWLELPHVSGKFWDDHPDWREKTALLEDAQLDWRKLMNLTNRDAHAAVSRGLGDLIARFDWDGINLAELYFESLEGVANPARLTPMNNDVRAEFRKAAGYDPIDLRNPQKFLDFRAELARRQQTEWIEEIEALRKTKPQLDLALTHVDDRFDTSMRDKIGADASALLPMLDRHDFTFLIEDPATIWNLGPQRYSQIAARYKPLTPAQNKLAIDINVVERYQDVYPTRQQTGTELFQLVHAASAAFPRVALYFENSILTTDLPLLSASASTVDRLERNGAGVTMNSTRAAGIPWRGPASVDGKPWPVADRATVWLPPGVHTIEPAANATPMRMLYFNGDLKSAVALPGGIEFAYQSSARAMAMLEIAPRHVIIDGSETAAQMIGGTLMLPRGQHIVTLRWEPSAAMLPSPPALRP